MMRHAGRHSALKREPYGILSARKAHKQQSLSTRTQTFCQRNSYTLAEQILVDTERNLIGHRTQPDQIPNATRSDGGRNQIGHRTQLDKTPTAYR